MAKSWIISMKEKCRCLMGWLGLKGSIKVMAVLTFDVLSILGINVTPSYPSSKTRIRDTTALF